MVYGLLGGVPLYLSWWDQSEDLSTNLARLACRPGARLLSESQLVLATEAEPGDLPAVVLHAVAAGRTRYGQIKDAAGAEPARTVDRLEQLRLLRRVVPVTSTGRGRRGHYEIADNFLAFALGPLARFRSEIDRGLGESILPVLLEALDDHLGARWEEAVRDHLRRLAVRGDLGPGVVAVGPWWDEASDVEVDALVLAGRGRGAVLALEATWARQVEGRRVSADLRRRLRRVPGVDPDEIRLAVAARESVRDAEEGVLALAAADVFS